MEAAWRLRDLVDLSTRTLAPEVTGESRRVRWVPNERLVRYYTTIGLLDRPSELRGRTAYYGRRHLLQLLAIKRLQGEGVSLKEIQQRLTGLTDRKLAALAGLEDGWEARLPEPAPEEPGERPDTAGAPVLPSEAQRAAFWAAPPAEPTDAAAAGEPEAVAPPALVPTLDLVGLVLAPGTTLLMDRNRYGSLDVAEVRRAAGPLIALLSAHGRKERA